MKHLKALEQERDTNTTKNKLEIEPLVMNKSGSR